MHTLPRSIRTGLSLALLCGFSLALGSIPALARLAANPVSLGFGNVQVGSAKSMYGSVKNTGRTSLKISKATLSGMPSFTVSGLKTPTTLSAGESLTFTVRFSPNGSGSKTAKLSFVANGTTLGISLSGNATPKGVLSVSPSSVSFGSVNVGSSKSVNTTVSASRANVVISSAGTTSGEFTLSGAKLPLTLAAGKSATFSITFRPQSSGSASGQAQFLSNALNANLAAGLSGTGGGSGGTPPPPQSSHSVSLTWNASSSSVAGYNIYRGTISGGPYSKINSKLNSTTTYTDGTVAGGKTYYYVATSVTSNGTESGYSAQVKAIVP